MPDLEIYILLFAIIITVGALFHRYLVPTALLLVIIGMALSFFPSFPHIELYPKLILDVFLPLMVYQISLTCSWQDIKDNLRPIALLSIGHVLVITALVAVVLHSLIPAIGWPLCILIGSIVSPPDDVAIVSIAERIRIPRRILTILKGEGMLNDATALTLFRFALVALATHEFSVGKAIVSFIMILLGETLYGIVLGHLLGTLRTKIHLPILQVMTSLLTPFLAYLPAERLGGCGILATVVTGLVIGEKYFHRFQPDVRLLAQSVWSTLMFSMEGFLFLSIGLEMRFILERISIFSFSHLVLYGVSVILTVIVGRVICVFLGAYFTRWLFPRIRKKEANPSPRHVFFIAWAGMRGGISLAAALAVPAIFLGNSPLNYRDLLVYIVFCTIIATLLFQGLALPWVFNRLGLRREGKKEQIVDHHHLLLARQSMVNSVLKWLHQFKKEAKDNTLLCEEIKLRMNEYQYLNNNLNKLLTSEDLCSYLSEPHETKKSLLHNQIVEIEKNTLIQLWQAKKINHAVKNTLLMQLDYRAKQMGY